MDMKIEEGVLESLFEGADVVESSEGTGEEKRKVRYDADTGVVDMTPFYDIKDDPSDGRPYVEMTVGQWHDCLGSGLAYYRKVYRDGTITEEPDPAFEKELAAERREQEAWEARKYLEDTDYVVSKINEATIDGDEARMEMVEKYADVLAKRKEARKRINELEAGEGAAVEGEKK